VTDIFFSYSSVDRERVRPVREALAAQGFEVFWDQQVPAGVDWDTWIRQHLAGCKCAMVFWSSASITSRNVRHEATIADQEGKLVPVLLEPLNARQFPMGLYAQQAANLADWNGDLNHEEWDKLRREYEAKLMPPWVRQRMDEKDAELVAERARRQGAERRDKTLQTQIAKEAETQQELKRERDGALDDIAALKTTVEELTRARSQAQARETDALQQIAALRATVDEVTRARSDAEQRLGKVRRLKAEEIVRSIATAVSPLVIAAAVATAGFWTYQLVWSAPPPSPGVASDSSADAEAKLKAAEIEQQRLQEEVQRHASAAAEAEARLQTALQAAQAEQQQQGRAVADADSKRRAAETQQQGLKEEAQRQAKAAADADAKLKVALTEQQRLAKAATDADAKRVLAETEQQRLAKAATDADAKRVLAEGAQQRLVEELRKVTAVSFESRPNMEAVDKMPAGSDRGSTFEACQARCARSGTCQAFTFSKTSNLCLFYDLVPGFRSNPNFDSGVRQSAAPSQPAQTVAATKLFSIKANIEASGIPVAPVWVPGASTAECEQRCAQIATCVAFAYSRRASQCYFYSGAVSFKPNQEFDSGERSSASSGK
jgi:TIR domain/PAN domain